ncbi:MAG: hypothetical protein JWR19_4044 [Pedosphaera sp.]|nr:hypothetical protein [Pedosphaera sp.]
MKNESDPNRLLDDLLEEIAPPAFRADLLDRTLKQVRHKRRLRQWNRGVLAAALIMLAGFLVWRVPAPRNQMPESLAITLNTVSSKPLDPSMVVTSDTKSVPIITSSSSTLALIQIQSSNQELRELNDDELFAALHGQPVLLVRQAPHQAELLLVDSATHLSHPADEQESVQR